MKNLINRLASFSKVIDTGLCHVTIKFKGKHYDIYEVDNENHSGYEVYSGNGIVYFHTEDEVVEYFIGDE